MTLQDFSRDVVPILQLVTGVAGLVGLVLVWRQIRQTDLWNRASAGHALLAELPDEEHDRRFLDACRKFAGGPDIPLSSAQCVQLFESVERTCVTHYLNKHEYLCVAIEAGIVDDEYAYNMHSARVVHLWHVTEQYVYLLRTKFDDPEIYAALQKTVTRWMTGNPSN